VLISRLCVVLITVGFAACAGHSPEPGQSLLVRTVDSEARLAAALAMPVCQDSLPVVGDTTGLGLVPPRVSVIVGPPMPFPNELRGTTSEVRILVNAHAAIDTIVVTGIRESSYLQKLREEMLARTQYLPAHMNGCRRAGWVMHKVTFNR
jgi:hypothetical protein